MKLLTDWWYGENKSGEVLETSRSLVVLLPQQDAAPLIGEEGILEQLSRLAARTVIDTDLKIASSDSLEGESHADFSAPAVLYEGLEA